MGFPMTVLSKEQVEQRYNTAGLDEFQNWACIEAVPHPCTDSSARGIPVVRGEEVTNPVFLECCSYSLQVTIYYFYSWSAAPML